MSDFMNDGILLENKKAQELYAYAKDLPIYDYHCHLSPREIYEDKAFFNLTELWLQGDHYKWRVMRAFGVDERFVTGDAAPYEKFEKFCEALPYFVGNSVYHWAHFELKKYFNLTLPICLQNAKTIWDKCEKQMADGSFSARKLIERSNVKCVITTDDPIDSLEWHSKIKAAKLPFEVLPCFRPDKAVNVEKDGFKEYVASLAKAADVVIDGLDSLLAALEKRLDFFVTCGCAAADVSFTDFPKTAYDRHNACLALKAALMGQTLSAVEVDCFKTVVVTELMKMFAKRNIVLELHVGVMRNCNTVLFEKAGVDAGGDSVANSIDIDAARVLFDRVNTECGLPKTIVYTLNPVAYYPIATLLGDFQGKEKGKLQLGAAWWFCDHRDGIKEQLRLTATTAGLFLFNGMLTDSRSFTSYARHDYFRRILCSLIGEWVENGEYPDDKAQLEQMIYGVCYGNAKDYFGGKI